uniref:Melanocortin 2 receptor accessory protein n=1 Tax=Sus scrofa TaxID=9823 RepID=A0A8D1V4D4_PIG
MANRTSAPALYDSYEYYLDYVDLIPVDEKKLKANKHLIVIAFWVSLVAFVVFLFLILLYMSWSGSPQTRNNTQHHPTCPWNLGLNLSLCFWRHPARHRAPDGRCSLHRAWLRDQAAAEHLAPSSGCSGRAPPSCCPPPPRPTLLSSGTWPSMGTRRASADIRNKPSERPLQTEPLDVEPTPANGGHC